MHTLLISLLAVGASPSSEVVFWARAPVNVSPEHARVFASLCSEAYGTTAFKVMRTEAAEDATPHERVELSLTGLAASSSGHRISVSERLMGTDGSVRFEASMEAASLDDAPAVCRRLAQALVTRTPVEAVASGPSVRAEVRERNGARGFAFGAKTGLIGVVGHGSAYQPMGSLAFSSRLEGNHWFTDLGAGGLVPAALEGGGERYGALTLEVAFGRYLSDTDFAPYLALGAQPRLTMGAAGSGFNLTPFAEAGLALSRTAGVRVTLEARVAQNVLPTSASGGVPATELSGLVGVSL